MTIQISEEEILNRQTAWGQNVVEIGSLKNNPKEYTKKTEEFVDAFYAFDKGTVLFKPTKTSAKQFRFDKNGAISYFIGGNKDYPEDQGFALLPWIKIRFKNYGFLYENRRSIVMGNYYFMDQTEKETKVEYTFGYTKDEKNQIKIDLHHSSLPFCAKN